MSTLIHTIAIVLSVGTGLMLAYYLIRVIGVMRRIATTLSNVRLLLLTVASQTKPVDAFVAGIHDNVATLDNAVKDLGAAVHLPSAGVR